MADVLNIGSVIFLKSHLQPTGSISAMDSAHSRYSQQYNRIEKNKKTKKRIEGYVELLQHIISYYYTILHNSFSLLSSFNSFNTPPQGTLSLSTLPLYKSTHFPLSVDNFFATDRLKKGWDRRLLFLRVKCLSEPNRDADPEPDKSSLSPSPSPSGISTYSWCAGLGGLGFIETGYLTYLKLTNSDAFCPIGGGTCGDILNSGYAVVLGTLLFIVIVIFLKEDFNDNHLHLPGVPLPLIGMIAYGLVATLALQLPGKDLPFGIGENNGRLILLGTTTSMASASAYFLYILSTKFAGASCSYCLVSALLSFSLFFTSLKIFGLQEIQKAVGLQLCIASLVVAGLSTSYNISQPFSTSLTEPELEFFTTEVVTESSPFALSLAKHLHSIGAKMYGAFWCSHCLEQKQMFGREAAKLLDYVECFPDGYRKGIKIAKACSDVGIEGFPMWVINDKVLSGEQELSELAKASGFEFEGFSQQS
ncbi:hypothetical protein LguiA_013925 [Lonicera macranthoides]